MIPDRLGPYRIEKLLGEGGMGSVYLGTHVETDQTAAVKTLSNALSRDEDFRVRFGGEIESLKKLRHPNIVQLLGWGEQDSALFYAMEYIDGVSLQDRLAEGNRVEWREVIRFSIDICKALKHAHDNGIIHRDLKPANLLLDAAGNIKLTDFGIAKLFGYTQLTAEGGVVGTADYMAPEQALGQPINHRCDLYSLGTVMYTLLAGRPPFLAKSMPEVVHKVCYEPPQPVRRFNASVPPQLESLIGELLEKTAEKRPPTARALMRRLEAMQHGLTEPNARPDSPADEDNTDFDYTEPGATMVPGEPHVHSATTRFSPAGEVQDSSDTNSAITQAPRKDATAPGDAAPGDAAPGEATSSGESTKASESSASKFTTLEEEASAAAASQNQQQSSPPWGIVALSAALLAIVVLVAWQALVAPSADELYATITAVATDGEAELATAKDDIDQFLARYPDDPRAAQVAKIKEEIELERLQKSFERRLRRPGATTALTAVERAYLEAVELARTRPEEAIAQLEAIVIVYGEQEDASRATEQVVALARRQLTQLTDAVEADQKVQRQQLQERIDAARALEKSDSKQAQRMYTSIVLLYEGKPWAAEIVGQAKAASERLRGTQYP